MDQLEKKLEGSQKRQKSRNSRRRDWDEVNGIGKEERRNNVLGDDGMNIDGDDDEWEDELDEEVNPTSVAGGDACLNPQHGPKGTPSGVIDRTEHGLGLDDADAIT